MFEKGDSVKVMNSSPERMLKGKYGTIKSITPSGTCRVFFRKFGEYDIPLSHLEKS